MLTIQNNLKTTNLETLSKRLIKDDYHNFKLSIVGGGFTEDIANCIISKLTSSKDAKIVVINDLTLQMICKLLEAGYKLENITLAFGKWNSNGTVLKDKAVYTIMNSFIKANVKEAIKTINLEELFSVKFDLIIANPPYGKIGANITKNIIDKVNFAEYINLLPANDYKRNTTKDLYNYQSDMETINDGFADAAVTTHLARIHKSKVNNMTLDEFERSQYIDPQLDKYFEENSKRNHYAIDAMPTGGYTRKKAGDWDITTTFIIGMRDMNHKHLPYSKNCVTYRWNVENHGTMADLPAMTNNTQLSVSNCNFSTHREKQNFVNFVYGNFKFISKVFTALNCDGTVHSIAFPKVDWTRPWTVEEILTDYGYTKTEIADVMADLNNFKGMED